MVARCRSFSRAAAELHLAPSAVSLQIKELEQSVGLPLFGRAGRSSSLTPAGEMLLVDVNKAFLALKSAEDTLDRLRGRETGTVSVGMVGNATCFVPRLLADFHALHPSIEMRVCVANREQLLKKLTGDEIDFAIMGQPPQGIDACSEFLKTQSLGIIAAPEHALARERSISAHTLGDFEFIVREIGSGTRAAMDRFFATAGVAPRPLVELANNESIKHAVIANMGLAFLSLQSADLELRDALLVVLDVVGLPLLRAWHVVKIGSEPRSLAAESLRRFIVESGRMPEGCPFVDAVALKSVAIN